jgi:hypothetical protein
MQKRLFDHIAVDVATAENYKQLADGANALTAYTRKHGDALGFLCCFEYTADADATYTISLTECDTVGGVYTAVAAGDRSGNIGTFTQAQLAALSPANVVRLGYHGTKSFVKVNITTANITDNVNTVFTRVTVIGLESGMKLVSANM